jgi:hypothetical protein
MAPQCGTLVCEFNISKITKGLKDIKYVSLFPFLSRKARVIKQEKKMAVPMWYIGV